MSEMIGIRPDVGVLSVLRYLNYKPWYALAEYVDNSIDSYLKNKEALLSAEGPRYKLRIEISINSSEGSIRICDNAAGISATDLGRALRMAEAPPDKTRLSEFGMGMKAASCWFAPIWSVQTKALGENVARSVRFDVNSIVHNHTQELQVKLTEQPASAHYTIVQLSQVFEPPFKKTTSKIQDHLASIYRFYLQSGEVIIELNGEPLTHEQPEVLVAPLHNSDGGQPIHWRHEVEFECSGGRTVKGFAAIRETGSTAKAGFALFRRGRVIVGSTEEGYRPEFIFGRGNSYRSQRLFGELHLEGFGVSHTKDGFQWDGCQDEFLELLHKALSDPQKPILAQAEKYRKREDKPAAPSKKAEPTPVGGSVGVTVGGASPSTGPLSGSGAPKPGLSPAARVTASGGNTMSLFPESFTKIVRLTFNEVPWQVHVELSPSYAHTEWLEIGDHLLQKNVKASASERQLGLRIALSHRFSRKMEAASPDRSTMIDLAVGLAIARTLAVEGGATNTSLILDYLSEVLALSNH